MNTSWSRSDVWLDLHVVAILYDRLCHVNPLLVGVNLTNFRHLTLDLRDRNDDFSPLIRHMLDSFFGLRCTFVQHHLELVIKVKNFLLIHIVDELLSLAHKLCFLVFVDLVLVISGLLIISTSVNLLSFLLIVTRFSFLEKLVNLIFFCNCLKLLSVVRLSCSCCHFLSLVLFPGLMLVRRLLWAYRCSLVWLCISVDHILNGLRCCHRLLASSIH